MLGMRAKSLALSTLLGGLVAFAWTTLSWNILDWHDTALNAFDNDEDVVAAIKRNAPSDGIYVLPSGQDDRNDGAAALQAIRKGPLVFAAVRISGFGSIAAAAATQFGSLLAAAFLISLLLGQMKPMSYAQRVIAVASVGLVAGLVVELPYWNWWGFPAAYTLVNIADSVVTWVLAGSVMALAAKDRGQP